MLRLRSRAAAGDGRPPRRPLLLLLHPDLLLVGGVTVPPSKIRVHSSHPLPPSSRPKVTPSPRPKGLLLCEVDGDVRRRCRHLLSRRNRFPTLPVEVCSLQQTPPRQRTPPTGLEVEGVSGGLQGQTGVLVGRGENLTCRVGTLLLMTAEELPSSWCFCAVCDIIFSAGSGKLTILASQSHAQVESPCDCVAKTASLPQQWAIIISQGSI